MRYSCYWHSADHEMNLSSKVMAMDNIPVRTSWRPTVQWRNQWGGSKIPGPPRAGGEVEKRALLLFLYPSSGNQHSVVLAIIFGWWLPWSGRRTLRLWDIPGPMGQIFSTPPPWGPLGAKYFVGGMSESSLFISLSSPSHDQATDDPSDDTTYLWPSLV